MLLQRALIVLLFLSVCSGVLLLSHYRFGSLLLLLAADLLVAAGLYEFYRLSQKKDRVSLPFGIFCGVVYCTGVFLTCRSPLLLRPLPQIVLPASCFALLFLFFAWRAVKGDFSSALFDFAALAGGVVFVAWVLSFVVRMNYFPPAGRHGPWWVLSFIVVVGGADSFALLFGKAFGKRRFSPRISPNKTVEGFLGGTLGGIALGLVCWAVFPLRINFGQALLMDSILSLISHVGDLAESALKRDAGVKDSGRLPGVGGVLDMMDSILFTAPVAYFFMVLWLK